ncbi:hypothetical protein PC116_g14539 [Phytophthora cactorum]|nr:hypothetical protein C6341_g11604 [Phytophthora cactorum]KAG4237403.1 hypothetical protein PC116_g14539 [Phytophthora cactorum]
MAETLGKFSLCSCPFIVLEVGVASKDQQLVSLPPPTVDGAESAKQLADYLLHANLVHPADRIPLLADSVDSLLLIFVLGW